MSLPLLVTNPAMLGAMEIDPVLNTKTPVSPSRSIHSGLFVTLLGRSVALGPISDIRNPLCGHDWMVRRLRQPAQLV